MYGHNRLREEGTEVWSGEAPPEGCRRPREGTSPQRTTGSFQNPDPGG